MTREELLSQIERVKELNIELKKELQNNLSSNEVTLKSRNITEEIFVKLRTLLDKTIFYYLSKKNYSIDLTKVYFPLSKTQNDFNSVIVSYGLNTLSQDHPLFYNTILSFQPFSSKDKEILTILHEKGSKEKHQFLTKEKKEISHVRTTFQSSSGAVSWSKRGVSFGNSVSMLGVPINPITQEPAFVPSTHQLTKHYEVSIKLADNDLEVSSLCDSLIKFVDEIVNKTIGIK